MIKMWRGSSTPNVSTSRHRGFRYGNPRVPSPPPFYKNTFNILILLKNLLNLRMVENILRAPKKRK